MSQWNPLASLGNFIIHEISKRIKKMSDDLAAQLANLSSEVEGLKATVAAGVQRIHDDVAKLQQVGNAPQEVADLAASIHSTAQSLNDALNPPAPEA